MVKGSLERVLLDKDSKFEANNPFVGLIECPKEDAVLKEDTNITVGLTEKNITVFDIDKMEKEPENIFSSNKVMDFIVSDKFYLYALCAPGKETVSLTGSTQDQDSGLYIYDMQSLVNQGNCEKYKLSQALVGQNASMDFNPSIMQIGFLKDYKTIRLLPLVHRNTATFFGMDKKEDYLIWRHE